MQTHASSVRARRVLLAPVALLAASAAASATIEQDATLAFSSLTELAATGEGRFTDEDAVEFRGYVDQNLGDGDGTVTAAEVAATEAYFEQLEEADDGSIAKFFRLDNKAPADIDVTKVSLTGLEGPVDSGDPVDFEEVVKIGFEGIDASKKTHRLDVKDNPDEKDDADASRFTITVPPGFEITMVEGVDGVQYSEGKGTVTGAGQADEDIVVEFQKKSTSGGKSPGLSLPLALPAVAGALWWASRRRTQRR